MSDLSISDLQAKIAQVDKDLDALSRQGATGRKLEVLSEYRDYLKDELKMLKVEENLNASKS